MHRRRIAFIGGEADANPNVRRLAGYRSALATAALPTAGPATVFTSFTRDGGRQGVDMLWERSDEWDAVVCGNDLIAIGAMERLRERGISVPEQVAVTGYDDIDAASLVSPSLTTVENPAREIGRTAARLLLAHLQGETESDLRQRVVLSNRLVLRQSTPTPAP